LTVAGRISYNQSMNRNQKRVLWGALAITLLRALIALPAKYHETTHGQTDYVFDAFDWPAITLASLAVSLNFWTSPLGLLLLVVAVYLYVGHRTRKQPPADTATKPQGPPN
jgi:hypothetical protein